MSSAPFRRPQAASIIWCAWQKDNTTSGMKTQGAVPNRALPDLPGSRGKNGARYGLMGSVNRTRSRLLVQLEGSLSRRGGGAVRGKGGW